MLSIYNPGGELSQLAGDLPPEDPLHPTPIVQTVKVKALSLGNALVIGAISGFAISLGTFAFSKLTRRR
jgi:hypothetical protein